MPTSNLEEQVAFPFLEYKRDELDNGWPTLSAFDAYGTELRIVYSPDRDTFCFVVFPEAMEKGTPMQAIDVPATSLRELLEQVLVFEEEVGDDTNL